MPTWDYDSYCNDNVMEYVQEYSDKELFDRVEDDLTDFLREPYLEGNFEFVLGVAIYCIRKGKKFSLQSLKNFKEICDILVEIGVFPEWKDKEKRRTKIEHERRILKAIIANKKCTFGNLILKPSKFEDLNKDY